MSTIITVTLQLYDKCQLIGSEPAAPGSQVCYRFASFCLWVSEKLFIKNTIFSVRFPVFVQLFTIFSLFRFPIFQFWKPETGNIVYICTANRDHEYLWNHSISCSKNCNPSIKSANMDVNIFICIKLLNVSTPSLFSAFYLHTKGTYISWHWKTKKKQTCTWRRLRRRWKFLNSLLDFCCYKIEPRY